MTDLSRITGAARTPARPGPGPIADDLVRRLEVTLGRRVGGRMVGDHRGSGLGLAIARGFVRANHGRVWAESLPAQGTTFVVELPL